MSGVRLVLFCLVVLIVLVATYYGGWNDGRHNFPRAWAPAPSQPRETPWTWDAPDSNARCYFLEDKPIGCYQKGEAP